MKRLIAAAGLLTLALAVPGVAQAATTGSIVGANINSAGTQVSVSNMSITFDSCGGSDPGTFGIGGCGALGGVVPASQTCPAGGVGIQTLWDHFPGYTFSSGPATFNSGARSVPVSSPVAYRVCLYSYFDSTNYGRTTPGLRADALTPAPTATSTSTGPTGKRAAASKKCKKFPKGPKRQKCIKKAKNLPV
jgi:hypothetical protein